MLLSSGCSSSTNSSSHARHDRSRLLSLRIELPEGYGHWEPAFESEWKKLIGEFSFYADRFNPKNNNDCRVVFLNDSIQAETFYKKNNLEGDPVIPRSFPKLFLATIFLPISDRLLSSLETPPQTLLHDFRHEATHLLSASSNEIMSAPLWFQEGLAEMLTPISNQDLHSWPHPHDIYRWWPNIENGIDEEDPSEVRYTWYAEKVRYLLKRFPEEKKPWLKEADLVIEKSVEPFLGLRGRHAFYDISTNHFLLASLPSSQVELDLPFIWDGRDRLEFSFRVGSASKALAGIVILNHLSSEESDFLARIPCDNRGGVQLFLDKIWGGKTLALSYPEHEIPFGGYSKFELSIENDLLKIKRGKMRKSIPLQDSGLSLPLRLRIYVGNGTFELKYEEIPN